MTHPYIPQEAAFHRDDIRAEFCADEEQHVSPCPLPCDGCLAHCRPSKRTSAALLLARCEALEDSHKKLLKTHDLLLARFHDLEIEQGLREDASGPSSPGPRCVYCQQTRAGTPHEPRLYLRNVWICEPCKSAEE